MQSRPKHHRLLALHPCLWLLASILGGTPSFLSGAEELDGFQDLMESPGYYPTAQELGLMGSEQRDMYRRSRGALDTIGPDAGSLTASGIWHQDPDPTVSFYEQHSRFFNGLDSALGPLVPQELLLWESNTPAREYLYGYTDFGFPLNRDFNPNLAHAKLGPLYFDLLTASVALLYSDYDGTPALATDDGWLSMLSLNFRATAQLTENLFLTLTGSIYYLPSNGSMGFFLGDGRASSLRLGYEGAINYWQYGIYNELRAHHPLSEVFDEVEHDEIDTAGRYRFGRYDSTRSNDFFDRDGFYFFNRLGTVFTGPMGDLINASISLERRDSWQSLGFDDHRYGHHLSGRLDYLGFEWPIIPFFQYSLWADNGVDELYESFLLGARARLSENVRMTGHVGYFRTHGRVYDYSQPVAELGIVQQLSARTSHSLFSGVRHHREYYGEDLLANYVRYSLAHRFGSRLRGTAFAQWSDIDNLDGTFSDRSGWSAGALLTADVSDYSLVRVGVNHDEWDGTSPADDRKRWIYHATLIQRLLPYLTGRLLYQFEDLESNGGPDFDEHLYMISLEYLF